MCRLVSCLFTPYCFDGTAQCSQEVFPTRKHMMLYCALYAKDALRPPSVQDDLMNLDKLFPLLRKLG